MIVYNLYYMGLITYVTNKFLLIEFKRKSKILKIIFNCDLQICCDLVTGGVYIYMVRSVWLNGTSEGTY